MLHRNASRAPSQGRRGNPKQEPGEDSSKTTKRGKKSKRKERGRDGMKVFPPFQATMLLLAIFKLHVLAFANFGAAVQETLEAFRNADDRRDNRLLLNAHFQRRIHVFSLCFYSF